ncbi:MAG: zinc ribbon domain-containing protein [Paludibacteraceae bacterium]|nr:zinc ribbon domain-containing protein [Paludibacteraceae bacterium]MBQ7996329.1 zinc ribbon domain-containing protein [Paludibacteraceae bacterium]
MSDYKTKGGELQHCPQCGAVVPESASVCPKCGYEFSEISANSSSVLLATMLAELEYDEDKCQAIETFPLPNSKADLLEFATALKPRIKKLDNPLSEAYMTKYQELIEKIKVSFPNDPQLKRFADEFDALYASIEQQKGKQARKNWLTEHMKLLVTAACIVVALIVGGGLLIAFRDTAANNADRCVTAVTKAVDKDNLKQARNFIVGYKKDKDDVIEGYVTLLSKYFDAGMWDDAKSLVEYYGQGQYTGDLNRGLYNYLLSAGDYDQAEEYINVESKPTDKEYYDYMEECVNLMCQAGLLGPAQTFIAKKALHFASNNTGYYSKARVQERLEKVINAYK